MLSAPPGSRVVRFGPFQVDLGTGEVWKNGRKCRVQQKPFQLLAILLQQRCKLVSRDELRCQLWPGDTFVDFENGLNTAISKLRDLLNDSPNAHRYIETLPRRGYRFVAHVEELGNSSQRETRELFVERKRIEPDISIIEITGKFILGCDCQQVEWLVATLLSEGERKIIFDICKVNRIDSTGIGIVAVSFGKIIREGGKLHVAATRTAEEALKLAKLDSLLCICPTVSAAVEQFGHSMPYDFPPNL